MLKYLLTLFLGSAFSLYAVSFDLEDFDAGTSGWSGLGSFAITASADGNPSNSLQGELTGEIREAAFLADSGASSGSFTGDYATAGVTTLTFDFYAATLAPTALFVSLYNQTDNIEFVRYLTTPSALSWASYAVTLDYAYGWIGGTSGEFTTMLGDVAEVAIGILGTDGAGSEIYRLDNVQLTNDAPPPLASAIPEPDTLLLVSLGAVALLFARRRLRLV